MRISKLLEAKGSDVATIGPEATVSEAVAELARHGVGALVVSEDGRRIEGIVSERDVVRGLDRSGPELLAEKVSSIMSSTVHTCGSDEDTDVLMSMMTERRIRHVPVIENDELIGIVSIGDIVKTKIGELEHERKELVDYINAR
jgi:CBS domain-containing protein